MIKPAQNYADKITALEYDLFYGMKYQYFHGGRTRAPSAIYGTSNENISFVSLDSNDNILGLIKNSVDYTANQAYDLAIISFKNSYEFARDVLKVIYDIFYKFKFCRLEFCAYADNPTFKNYKRFIQKFGGREAGYFRKYTKLLDNEYHDRVIFEILDTDLNDKLKNMFKEDK